MMDESVYYTLRTLYVVWESPAHSDHSDDLQKQGQGSLAARVSCLGGSSLSCEHICPRNTLHFLPLNPHITDKSRLRKQVR